MLDTSVDTLGDCQIDCNKSNVKSVANHCVNVKDINDIVKNIGPATTREYYKQGIYNRNGRRLESRL